MSNSFCSLILDPIYFPNAFIPTFYAGWMGLSKCTNFSSYGHSKISAVLRAFNLKAGLCVCKFASMWSGVENVLFPLLTAL